MRQLWVPWLLLLLVACRDKAPADGALRVSVSYGSYTPGCVRVVARDGQGHEGSKDIPRSQFQPRDTRELIVAVFRKPDWGRELTVEVSSHEGVSGEECAGTPVEVRAPAEPVSIPLGDFARLSVALQAKDEDGDTFIHKEDGVAGTDCDDGRDDVHPGATELCSVNVDFDCNGSRGCQDSACQDKDCDDGSACTTGDHCQGSGASAVCVGQEKQCTQPTSACLTGAQCDPRTGQCVNLEAPQGTACDDGNPCTLVDRCGPQALCTGSPKPCEAPPSTCHQSTGTCNTANGLCNYDFKAVSVSCDDTVGCTVNDACNGAGVCQGTPTPCTASSVCKRVTGGCVALNTCTEEPDPSKVNTACMLNPSRPGVCRTQDGVCSTFPYAPSNFNPDTVPLANIGTLATTCAVTFDSEALTWTPVSCVTDPPPPPLIETQGGKDMVVLAMSSLSLGAELTLRGTRPVILAVYGNATLNQNILANGTFVGGVPVPGAGGHQDCATRKGLNGLLANNAGGGGGGAGGGTVGAAGNSGKSSSPGAGAGGGAGDMGGSCLVPLVGGCPGGSGGGGTAEAGKAGAGGGAVQLSVAGTLTVNQWITASGGGGGGATGSTTSNGHAGGGGGGGSGGRVLLEANKLTLAATTRLTANGGGGGEGGGYLDAANQSTGFKGEDGARSSAMAASGGNLGSFSGGDGGAGGVTAITPVMGAIGTPTGSAKGGGGGGGGAVGHIRLRSLEACSLNGALISPATNTACPL